MYQYTKRWVKVVLFNNFSDHVPVIFRTSFSKLQKLIKKKIIILHPWNRVYAATESQILYTILDISTKIVHFCYSYEMHLQNALVWLIVSCACMHSQFHFIGSPRGRMVCLWSCTNNCVALKASEPSRGHFPWYFQKRSFNCIMFYR